MPPKDRDTKTCFVIMPFGKKKVGRTTVDFDAIYAGIFEPAIRAVPLPAPETGNLDPHRTDRDFFTGDIGQDMFEYLQWSRFAIADITGLNANVMYELGVRHAARESGTVILRQTDAPIPFDINRIKAFPYEYRPKKNAEQSRQLIERVLRESLQQNRLDSPVQIALRAQQAEPNLEPLLLEAENAIRRFDRPAAITILRKALRMTEGNPLLHQRLGLMLRDQGDLKASLTEFDAAVKSDPNYGEGWREKGVAQSILSRKPGWTGEDGEASLRKAIELNPDDFDALASLGGVLRRKKQLDEALSCYERSAQTSSGHPYPLLMAVKLRACKTGKIELDDELRSQLIRAERMRNNQAGLEPPFDVPWCFFDSADVRLYLGDAAAFLSWLEKGLAKCEHSWQAETERSALQLLIEGGVDVPGLRDGIAKLDAAIPNLP